MRRRCSTVDFDLDERAILVTDPPPQNGTCCPKIVSLFWYQICGIGTSNRFHTNTRICHQLTREAQWLDKKTVSMMLCILRTRVPKNRPRLLLACKLKQLIDTWSHRALDFVALRRSGVHELPSPSSLRDTVYNSRPSLFDKTLGIGFKPSSTNSDGCD